MVSRVDKVGYRLSNLIHVQIREFRLKEFKDAQNASGDGLFWKLVNKIKGIS
jgi:hypothetical protein